MYLDLGMAESYSDGAYRTNGRIDKFQMMIVTDVAVMVKRWDEFKGQCEQVLSDGEMSVVNKFDIGYEASTKTPRYVFDSYGVPSDHIAQLATLHAWASTCRVDYRLPISGDKEKLMELTAELANRNGSNKNIMWYSSRPRKKENKRGAGGIGVAIGSHTSDRRVTVYKRGDEPMAIEIQLTGKALRRVLDDAVAAVNDRGYYRIYDGVIAFCYQEMIDFLRPYGFAGPMEIEQFLTGGVMQLPAASSDDQKVQTALALMDTMGEGAKRAFLAAAGSMMMGGTLNYAREIIEKLTHGD